MLEYPLAFKNDDDGSILVTSPDFPELTSFGADMDEARAMGVAALAEAIAGRLHDFRSVPAPSHAGSEMVRLSLHLSLVLALFWALKDAGITRAELGRRLDWQRTQVDRLFHPNHESRLSQLDAAFEALGKHPHLDIKGAA